MRAVLRFRLVAAAVACALGLVVVATMPHLTRAQPGHAAETAEIAAALDRRFTYQGRLFSAGAPVNGDCDLRFSLYDAGSNGNQVGSEQVVDGVTVADGLLVVTLNEANQFGNTAFTGDRRWLQIGVRCPAGSGDWITLSPRQALDPAPYALYALSAASAASAPWSGITGVPDGVANPPTYSAGPGLQLSGEGQFSVVFGGNGAAGNAARSDHNHFGQSWSGSHTAAGLTITNNEADGAAYGLTALSHASAGRGVFGRAAATSGETSGVHGISNSTSGRGVFGWATAATGGTDGVHGRSDSPEGYGVFGIATASTGPTRGVVGQSDSEFGWGVFGRASATNGNGTGVAGNSAGSQGRGVSGLASATSGVNYGVYGATNSAEGYAGYFAGRTFVAGVFDATTKHFLIDHPLDPAHKLLRHASVESSEQLNLYTGNVTLDVTGAAEVGVPDWFTALNTDFRYQLTAIGAAAPGLHVAAKLHDNRFHIAGGAPGMEVSWQITGVRHDPSARLYPLIVEEDKAEADRGTYLIPAAFGQPRERGTHYHASHLDRLPMGPDASPRE